MTTLPSTAVIGLGPMGAPIARNLLRAGVPLQVWNRTAEVAAPFAAEGAVVRESVDQIDADVILSVLPDVPQLRALLTDEVLEAWRATGPLLVVMSTTSPAQIEQLAADLAGTGIRVADSPMSGGDLGAQQGTLSLMVGAEEADYTQLEPVLRSIGRTIVRFGGPGTGAVAKLANQIVVAGTLSAIGEALALAERSGVDPAVLVPVLEGGLAGSAVLSLKKEKLLTGDYSLGGSATNQLKDLTYAADVAARTGAYAPLTELLHGVFDRIEQSGRGQEDHSVVLEYFRGRLEDAAEKDAADEDAAGAGHE